MGRRSRSLAVAAAAASFAAAPGPAAGAAVPTTACAVSAQAAQADRRPDVHAGPSIQVVYAHPSDLPDNFAALASMIATDVATGNAWFLREDPARAPRWDLFPFPGCGSELGQLDIADVTLPGGFATYAPLDTRWDLIRTQLAGPPFGFDSGYKKYLVYYDGPVDQANVCGQGGAGDPDGYGFAVVFVQTCRLQIGDGGQATTVAVHELLHTFGLVDARAPHACRPHNGHTCDLPARDLMSTFVPGPIDGLTLDPGRDDYWGHGGDWTDGRRSPFLIRLDAPHPALNLRFAGGAGLVESDVPGVYCSASCTSTWEQGTEVTLAATPPAGRRFVGWRGACTGKDPCFLQLGATTDVTAVFGPATQFLRATVAGRGAIVSVPRGIACPRACAKAFAGESTVRLTAKPGKGYRLAAWSGACRGARATCAVVLDTDRSVRARFVRRA